MWPFKRKQKSLPGEPLSVAPYSQPVVPAKFRRGSWVVADGEVGIYYRSNLTPEQIEGIQLSAAQFGRGYLFGAEPGDVLCEVHKIDINGETISHCVVGLNRITRLALYDEIPASRRGDRETALRLGYR